MKKPKKKISKVTSDQLKAKLKQVSENESENNRIRLHRAISWLKCAEEQSDIPDLKFITLWISFNACYAEAYNEEFTEKERFREFVKKLVEHDSQELFFNILWNKFSGPVRLLIENQYAYKYFWAAQRNNNIEWEKSLNKSIKNSNYYLVNNEIDKLLEVVLDRLYTVRNQLLHGGATYKSKVNRSQVKDASNILEFLMPVIIDIMITKINDDWGDIKYPVVNYVPK